MSLGHALTDRKALGLHRKRAFSSSAPAPFLHRAALDEIRQRLADIDRSFERTAVITGCEEFWKNAFPDAEIFPDEERIDFGGNRYGLVVHAMALHWSNDPVGQLVQCRLAMIPDGLLLAVCFGGETLTELRAALLHAEIRAGDGASPRVAPMAGVRDCGSLLQRAGFALPVADRVALSASYSTTRRLMHDLRSMGETNALAARRRTPARRSLFDFAEEVYRGAFADGRGRLRATFDLMFLTGWVPSAGQQQPLRPGSARSLLADALNTVEHKLSR